MQQKRGCKVLPIDKEQLDTVYLRFLALTFARMYIKLYWPAIMTSLGRKQNGVGMALNVATLPLMLCYKEKNIKHENVRTLGSAVPTKMFHF